MTTGPMNLKRRLAAAVRRARQALDPDYDPEGNLRVPRPAPGEEPDPPWVTYAGSSADWGGWRQGVSEVWLHEVWLPFWKSRSPEQRSAYLARWPPPDSEWRERLGAGG